MVTAKCGGCNAIGTIRSISYGFLADEAAADQEVVSGGCCISDDDPEFACKECGWTCYFDATQRTVKRFIPGQNLGLENFNGF